MCLYIVCRWEKSPNLLIDFADALQTNVYTLGHTFLKLKSLLRLKINPIDPSLYIHRFADKYVKNLCIISARYSVIHFPKRNNYFFISNITEFSTILIIIL